MRTPARAAPSRAPRQPHTPVRGRERIVNGRRGRRWRAGRARSPHGAGARAHEVRAPADPRLAARRAACPRPSARIRHRVRQPPPVPLNCAHLDGVRGRAYALQGWVGRGGGAQNGRSEEGGGDAAGSRCPLCAQAGCTTPLPRRPHALQAHVRLAGGGVAGGGGCVAAHAAGRGGRARGGDRCTLGALPAARPSAARVRTHARTHLSLC